jgi:hypothetical protein
MSRIAELPAPVREAAGVPTGAAVPAAAGAAASPRARNPLTRALAWLWTPRPIALRPAWGLAAAALVLALAVSIAPADERALADAAPATPATAEIYVSFRLDAPEAMSVHLAGDFTDWQPSVELHESQPGVWTVVVPLEAGVHDYAFVIDGERWTPDPLATRVDDGFGGENSRLSLLPPERTRA